MELAELRDDESLMEVTSTPGVSTAQNALVPLGDWSSSSDDEENNGCIVENDDDGVEVPNVVNTVTNSSDVRIVHRNTRVYQAPVTVNQTVINRRDSSDDADATEPSSRNCYILIAIFVAIALSLLVVTISIWLSNRSIQSSISTEKVLAEDKKPKIVTRYDWGAVPAIKPTPKLSFVPAPYVVISETKTASCNTIDKCKQRVRSIQSLLSKIFNVDDIPFNFLVGGDGFVYEGRGWDVVGDHTLIDYFDRSVIVSFIGSFSGKYVPTKEQLRAAMNLIEFGVKNGKISVDYKLKGRRQFRLPQRDENPSDNLYDVIKTWEHWDPNDESISRDKLN